MILAEVDERERAGEKGRWEYRLIARDGKVVWVIDDEAVIARDGDGRPKMVQGILVNITDRKDLEDQLRHQALHDPLTGLPNRVLFVDRLSHALVRRQAAAGLAVLFVDLDDFKAINDTLGHAAGDELLRLVAERLVGVLRAEDTACRLGGDEFAFLLEDADRARAEQVARRILAALAIPFQLGERAATLTASIGIATRDTLVEGDPVQTADEMLRDADTAMYVAKARGKELFEVFERGMEDPIARRRELLAALERALQVDDELLIEYQPIVDMRRFKLLGLEALVRWQHPQLGLLMPADFVPLAEETGLIRQLGEWVLRRACADLADRGMMISINVSAQQLGDGALRRLLVEILASSGLPPSLLLLELTESTLASAAADAETELAGIQELGVRIALDDFGSGYSSLEYLGRLPIDVLKIDRSLVERIHEEPQRQEVMRAIAHIAEKLDLETIVEGVELEAQRQALLSLGFRRAQGFLFSTAMSLDDALRCRWSGAGPPDRSPREPDQLAEDPLDVDSQAVALEPAHHVGDVAMQQLRGIGVGRELDRLRQVDDRQSDHATTGGCRRTGQRGRPRRPSARGGSPAAAPTPIATSAGERCACARRGAAASSVADELHDDAVLAALDRVGDRGAGRPGELEHRHLLDRPHALDDLVAVIGLVRDGSAVAARQEPAGPIRGIVAVAGGLLEAEVAQLAACGAARTVSLVGEERGRAAVVSALEQEDLCLLAGFQGAERDLVVGLFEQPRRGLARWRG